ncbi:MAG: NAD(P)H-dependent oxidoreductase [Ktedonobacterales bacterium]|nr:NAD(P)H-dependent oxidoreductase [Ktedonobacterales bacterium]
MANKTKHPTATNLQIIVGSTRETRNIDLIVPWVAKRAAQREAFAVEVLDLRDWELPLFAEHMGTLGDINDPTYSAPVVKQWNAKIAAGDAYLFITPEYTHSIPAVLKNAIDSVFASFAFRNKPAAFVGYSVGIAAGTRAVEHLASIAIEAELIPLRNTVLIAKVQQSFAHGEPVDPETEVALDIMLDDLAWWAEVLKQARAGGELPPASVRRRLATAKRTNG